jgi:hypothetical protein
MASHYFAPRVLYQTMENNLVINENVRIHGIVASTNGPGQNMIYVRTADSSKDLMRFLVEGDEPDSDPFIFNIPFIADQGLRIVPDIDNVNLEITVFYTHAGT